jgi:dipeptidyl aminopeptidase/acylaminoacyl peptidase
MCCRTSAVMLLLTLGTLADPTSSAGADQKKRFTITDEIGLTRFEGNATVSFSPDGRYFAVWSEQGHLDGNYVEDSLRIYSGQDVVDSLSRADGSPSPAPVWIASRSAAVGDNIRHWQWLTDSSGLAFLGVAKDGNQLFLADLKKRAIVPLSPAEEDVSAFDVRDRDNYVYTASNSTRRVPLPNTTARDVGSPMAVGTGLSLAQLLFPEDRGFVPPPPSYLWAVVSGKRFQVMREHAPIIPSGDLPGDLALSPDGTSLVTTLPVREVPSSWEVLYPPAFPSAPFRVRAGRDQSVHQFVLIDLKTGLVRALTSAPIGGDGSWWGSLTRRATWSNDGRAILLPETFVETKDRSPTTPCLAVVNLPSYAHTCVETSKIGDDYRLRTIIDAKFATGNKQRVVVHVKEGAQLRTLEYELNGSGAWQVVTARESTATEVHANPDVIVSEGLNEPPRLIAREKERSRVIWDPNPQLKEIELGQASIYVWKDKAGHERRAGLYRPADYEVGRTYPLVIQTHGFLETEFRPSGLFTTGSAARALAGAGVFVLQIGEDCHLDTPAEGPCAAEVYESAANALVAERLVDPARIGIVGFSRTCFYVMEALTTSSVRFSAALITDGLMASYVQYISTIDGGHDAIPHQFDSMIGASPFGEGLQQWVRQAPTFNLDRIVTPLLVVASYRGGHLLNMWEPYAGLRYLHKPTDLVLLKTDEHVVTTPAVRLASQGGSVDWFRFWLQGYEGRAPKWDPDQYRRWEKLCDMQVAENRGHPTFCVATKH